MYEVLLERTLVMSLALLDPALKIQVKSYEQGNSPKDLLAAQHESSFLSKASRVGWALRGAFIHTVLVHRHSFLAITVSHILLKT